MTIEAGGLKWWQWGVVVVWVGGVALFTMEPAASLSQLTGRLLGGFVLAYLVVYGLRKVWGPSETDAAEQT
jgi:hypothetical protein